VTILQNNGASVISDCGISSNTLLDGFTIAGGNGTSGGIYNTNSSPTINNCTFSQNSNTSNGGAIDNESFSSPTITNSIFNNNTTTLGYGGAIENDSSSPNIINCTFSNNSTALGNGGAIENNNSSPIITNCTFVSNETNSNGGAIDNESFSSPTITNCTFSNNSTALGNGGSIENNNSSPYITNCTFISNETYNNGGAIDNELSSAPAITKCVFSNNITGLGNGGAIENNNSSPSIANCVFTNNMLPGGGNGGAIDNESSSSPIIVNCTFSNNNTGLGNGGAIENNSSSPVITNAVFWGNNLASLDITDDIDNNNSSPTVNYSFTQTAIAGTGNIQGTADPFVNDSNPAGADSTFGTADDGLELTGCTLAVNSGNNAADTAITDITGQPRIFNSTIDMGAYEYQAFPDGTSLALNNDTTTQTIYPGINALIVPGTCRVIAKLFPDGISPVAGTLVSKVFIDSAVQAYLGQPYVPRHYSINPATNTSAATAAVTLYFAQSEFDSFNTVSTVKLPTDSNDVTGIANLNVIQLQGTSATGIPGIYSGATITINPADSNIVWNSTLNRWEITFNVKAPNSFIVSTNNDTVLPLTLLSFTGQLVNGENELQWQTANENELNTNYFEVDKSTDDINFSFLANIKAIGSGDNTYTASDTQPHTGNNYYRLKLVNNYGTYFYSDTILIQDGFFIYPNPTSQQLVINYAAANNAIISIYNLAGQKVLSMPTNGQTKTTIDVSNLTDGTYMIRYNSDTETLTNKFIKID
jgi:hypothetical protein